MLDFNILESSEISIIKFLTEQLHDQIITEL